MYGITIRRHQFWYGVIWGALAFAVGWAATYYVLPEGVLADEPRQTVVSWFYLGAHGMEISASNLVGIVGSFAHVNPLDEYAGYEYLRVVPFTVLTVSGLLVNLSMGYTERFKHILANSAVPLFGYGPAVTAIFFFSDARPGIGIFLFIAVIGGLSLYVGTRIIGSLNAHAPIFGVASLGSIVLLGLFVVLGGIAIVEAAIPLLLTAALAVGASSVLTWAGRTSRL